jgi:hypothetical protein
MVQTGAAMDPDFNNFDAFHEAMPHPQLKEGAWTRLCREAWQKFYSLENMKAVLSRAHPDNYWDILRHFYWYKNSVFNEGAHPMMAGFFRWKDRTSRRPGFPIEGRLAHLRRRAPEIWKYLRGAIRLTLEMEELWLATRKRSETERRVLAEVAHICADLRRGLRISELQAAYARAKAHMPSIEVPSRLRLLWEKVPVLRVSRLRATRLDLTAFWGGVCRQLRRGNLLALLRADRIALNAFWEIRLATCFLIALATATSYEAS